MTRRLAIWILLLICFVATIAGAASSSGDVDASLAGTLTRNGVTYDGRTVQKGRDGASRVAMIPIAGTMVNGASSPDGSTSGADDVVRMIDAVAARTDDFDGVILEIDTPGGAVLAAQEINAALARLKEKSKLPVLAWMRGSAASGGYYVAAPTDHVIAAPSTITGSIGVILEYYVLEGLADKVGVEAVTIKSGELKDIGNPLRGATREERELFQSIIDESYDAFVQVVVEGRDLPEDEVRRLADGRIYTGQQAKQLDLVDSLGLQHDAFEQMAKLIKRAKQDGEDLHVVRFTRRYGFLQSLSVSAQPTLDSLAAARAVGSLVRGDGALPAVDAHAQHVGNGVARLEYRAQL